MNTEQLNTLYEKLEVKSRRGRGGDYNYVPWQDVADRMNKVFSGNWSSEVMSEISIDNGIILRVRVTIIDEKTNVKCYQEGYGGANIAGAEVGTLHKSAYSKALRDACKKWGPGLYTDDISDFSKESKITTTIPSSSSKSPITSISAPPVSSAPIISVSNTPVTPVTSVTTASTPPISTPVPNIPTPVAPINNTLIPPTITQPHNSVVEQIATASSLPGTQKPILSPVTESKNSLPPITTIPTATAITTTSNQINDVQIAALEGILELKDITFEELVKEAFEDSKLDITNLPTKEKLTYQQAVMIIKYGNEKFRK